MTYARARAELYRLTVRAVRPGLGRTRVLLRALKHPDHIPAIQITGTNGKGSVAALLASALTAAGYRAGRFTSPHLQQERERIFIAGAMLSARAFARAAEKLLPGLRALHQAGNPATTFEAWTALAAEAFRQARVEVAVVEVGLGGRLDATSVWQQVILSVLTQVSLDHTRELGPDVESICREKLAIARPDVPFVTAESDPHLRALIRARGRKWNFPVFFAAGASDAVWAGKWERTARGLKLDLECDGARLPGIAVPLRGEHQVENVVLAALAIQQLQNAGFPVPEAALRRGFATVVWRGRLELASRNPDVFLDGAHNPAAAQAIARELQATSGPVYLVAGVMADKDVAGIVRALKPAIRQAWTVTPPDDRGLPAADLATRFQSAGITAEPARSMRAALDQAARAAGKSGTILVAGSLYNIAPARKALKNLGFYRNDLGGPAE